MSKILEIPRITNELPVFFRKPNGMMIHGDNNPSNNMILADNGEIQVGGRIGIYLLPMSLDNVNNKYVFGIDTDTNDWNMHLCLGLVDSSQLAEGESITDLYDVTISILPDTEEHTEAGPIVFTLTNVDGDLHLIDEENVLDVISGDTITKLGVTDDKIIGYQNIQRVSQYLEQLNIPNNLGKFQIVFNAVRKFEIDEQTPELTLSFNVEVQPKAMTPAIEALIVDDNYFNHHLMGRLLNNGEFVSAENFHQFKQEFVGNGLLRDIEDFTLRDEFLTDLEIPEELE